MSKGFVWVHSCLRLYSVAWLSKEEEAEIQEHTRYGNVYRVVAEA